MKELEKYRDEHKAGHRINIKKILSDKKNIHRLGSTLVLDIVKDSLEDISTTVGGHKNQVYISKNGKKYHTTTCVYCKGKDLFPVTMATATNICLSPCPCVDIERKKKEEDRHWISVFIDESIRKIFLGFENDEELTG